MSKIYVAYGSNLNIRQMKKRCPDAVLLGTGYLKNWKLLYRGRVRAGGVATVKKKAGNFVPVALWRISDADEKNLDIYEGYPWLYTKQNVFVYPRRTQRRILGMMYVMTSTYSRPAAPSDNYVNTIMQGYRDCRLDMKYLDESLETNSIELKRGRL